MTTINLSAKVDELFNQQVTFLSELVASKSTRGNEQQAQAIMQQSMSEDCHQIDTLDMDIDKIKDMPGFSPVTSSYANMTNIIGNYGNGNGTGRSLILNGHIDVVPEGPLSGWSHDPYTPIIKDNKLYGRGSSDMKSGLTAKVFALKAIKQLGYEPNASVYLQSVVEEECTGNGALSCLAAGYKADAVLIAEPFNEVLVRSQVGVIWFQIKLQGMPVHAERASESINTIEAMIPVIAALRELEHQWNHEKHNYPEYAHHQHPINLNIAEFHAGDWTSSVPSWATLNLRIAIYPGDSISIRQQQIEQSIKNLVKENTVVKKSNPQVIYHGFLAEGYCLEEGTDAEKELSIVHQDVFSSELESRSITATTDARFFGLYQDTPSLVYGPKGEGFHGFDECVDLESLKNITKVYAKFIQNWCGLRKI